MIRSLLVIMIIHVRETMKMGIHERGHENSLLFYVSAVFLYAKQAFKTLHDLYDLARSDRIERKKHLAIMRSDFFVDNSFVMQMNHSFEHICFEKKKALFS